MSDVSLLRCANLQIISFNFAM